MHEFSDDDGAGTLDDGMSGRSPGWYPNLTDEQDVRWWDGRFWTERVGTVLSSDGAALHKSGLFDYTTPADGSLEFADKLKAIRTSIKAMNRDGTAISMRPSEEYAEWSGRDSLPAQTVKAFTELTLGAFNSHAESAIKNLRYGNYSGNGERLQKAANDANKAGWDLGIGIGHEYHLLRLEELSTAWFHLCAKKRESDEARDRRAELREENKVQVELAAERTKLEKEREHYQNAFAALEAKGDDEGALRMLELLEDIDRRIADVDYRAANIRAGYVYVISNVGTLGDNIVKIGMTRRLEPMDRVKELSNASVPFRYDVHALFFSTDAVSVETMLHNAFDDYRVNKINRRREFFYVKPHQVLEALQERKVELVEWTEVATAAEYRLGLGLDVSEDFDD